MQFLNVVFRVALILAGVAQTIACTQTHIPESGPNTLGARTLAKSVQRPWLSQDSIRNQYVALEPTQPRNKYPYNPDTGGVDISPISVSPSGEYFFFIASWGDLHSDTEV